VQGPQGPTGPTGPAPLTAVGSFFSTSVGTSVAANASAPLTTAGGGNTAGAFTLASNTVTVVNAGTYLVWYRAAINAGTAVFAVVANETVVPGTLGVAQNVAAGNSRQLTGSATVTLTANSTILIRNVLTTADTLAAAADGQSPTSVTVTLVKVG
jgi:hypothetical protein